MSVELLVVRMHLFETRLVEVVKNKTTISNDDGHNLGHLCHDCHGAGQRGKEHPSGKAWNKGTAL